jgi:hypothetical protein
VTFFDEGLVELFDFLLHACNDVRMVIGRYSGHLLSYLATNMERYVFWGSIFGGTGTVAGA